MTQHEFEKPEYDLATLHARPKVLGDGTPGSFLRSLKAELDSIRASIVRNKMGTQNEAEGPKP